MGNIYAMRLVDLSLYAGAALVVWSVLYCVTDGGATDGGVAHGSVTRHGMTSRPSWRRRLFLLLNGVLVVVAMYAIVSRTVWGRVPSNRHAFAFFSGIESEEFVREMFMNGLLYLPLGLTLTALVGPWSVLVGLVLSVCIETWQYVAGTGLAQGTDVLCNVLGCAMGVVPYLVWRARRR